MVHARDGAAHAQWLCGATRLREEPIKKEGGTARDGRLIDLHVAVHMYISAISGMSARAQQQLRHDNGEGSGPAARSLLHGAGEGCVGAQRGFSVLYITSDHAQRGFSVLYITSVRPSVPRRA